MGNLLAVDHELADRRQPLIVPTSPGDTESKRRVGRFAGGEMPRPLAEHRVTRCRGHDPRLGNTGRRRSCWCSIKKGRATIATRMTKIADGSFQSEAMGEL